MIRVIYSEPELKDIIEGIIDKNFFIFCNETILDVLDELDLPPKLMNKMVVRLVPHDKQDLGLAYKDFHFIKLKIQDTLEENEKTLIHEAIHVLKPLWSEDTVEETTNKIHKKIPREISI